MDKSSSSACLVSGGIDSMVLLEMSARIQREWGFKLCVVHFNYHLRGEESERDEAFVREECRKRGVQLLVVDTPIKKGAGVQNRVREERLKIITTYSKQYNWTHVLMGHQADDQAETFIMHWLRGAGLKGLSGMKADTIMNNCVRLVRPLLNISRNEIREFAFQEGILFMEDSTNKELYYWRNRVRHSVINQLKKRTPHILTHISKMCDYYQKEDQRTSAEVYAFLKKIEKKEKGVSREAYFNLSKSVRFSLIESLMKKAGFLKQVTRKHFVEMEQLLLKKKYLKREYGSVCFVVSQDAFQFISKEAYLAKYPKNWFLKIDGEGSYWVEPIKQTLMIQVADSFIPSNKKPKKLYLADHIKFPLTVRFPKPGDRFSPYGLGGSKKLKDFFIDRKVPREERQQSLVVCQNEQILCIVGHEIDHQYRVVGPQKGFYSLSLVV